MSVVPFRYVIQRPQVLSDDTLVRLGYFDSAYDFYLRVHIPGNYEISPNRGVSVDVTEPVALLDFTCPSLNGEQFQRIIEAAGVPTTQMCDAYEFFTGIATSSQKTNS